MSYHNHENIFRPGFDALSLIEKEGGKEREEEGRQEEGQKEK